MNTADATHRFSDRVDAYVRYRPGYPDELVATLLEQTGIVDTAVVADIGSGTGIFTRLLLEAGLEVYAVEPNSNMREAAEALLSGEAKFISVNGPAEQTGLADQSVDLVTAAQAFHWFNNETTKHEFRRILKPDGALALIWNRRNTDQPFQQAYDGILREFAPEYGAVNHMNLSNDDIAAFFAAGSMTLLNFEYRQRLDFSGLLGRLKSASYCPAEDSPRYIPLVTELLALFDQFAVNGVIDFEYDTQLYLGPVAP
jgi:SAM-dependent methyltransferase